LASDDTQESLCQTGDFRNFTAIVLCPADLNQEQWRDAGADACGDRKPCAAWIWTNEEIMPAEAPETPEDFSQEQIVNAVAIWVNEDQNLITIAPVTD